MSEIEHYEKKYPKHLVVMQNKILQAFHQMTLDEKRLIVLASAVARCMDATEKDAIQITAEEFAQATGIQTNSAYNQLEQASQTMMKRQFSYKNERGKRVNVQWIIRSIYEDGAISLCFTDEVLFMLKVFNAENPFTKYKKQDVLQLKRDYSIDLYHIFKKRQGESFREERNTFVITLDELKTELGLSKAYDRISNLKSRVIKPSIAEINKKTDVIVNYSDTKKGRTINGFKFTVKQKPQPKKDKDDIKAKNGDLFTIDGLSDAQLARITRSPDFIKDYSRRISPNSDMNKDMSLWTAHFVQELKKDASKFNKRPIKDYLDY